MKEMLFQVVTNGRESLKQVPACIQIHPTRSGGTDFEKSGAHFLTLRRVMKIYGGSLLFALTRAALYPFFFYDFFFFSA